MHRSSIDHHITPDPSTAQGQILLGRIGIRHRFLRDMEDNRKLGLLFSAITAVMWGLLPLALKGILPKMDPITLTWFRFSLPALIAFLWYGRRSGRDVKKLFSRPYRFVTILTVAGLLLNYTLYILGLNLSTASAAQITVQLAPLLLLLGSVILFKEPFSKAQSFGALSFCLGFGLFFHHRLEELANANGTYARGIFLVVLAAIAWSVFSLAQKRLIKEVPSKNILLIIYCAGTVAFLPFASPLLIFDLNGGELLLLLFASLNTLIAYSCFGLAMTYWEASRVSAAITPAPLLTLLFSEILAIWSPGYMTLEPLDWLTWAGAILVVCGSSAAALSRKRRIKV